MRPSPNLPDSSEPRSYTAFLAAGSQGRPKGERTRARIRIAACSLLCDHAPQNVTVPRICQEAGIAHGTLYLHFPDRNALLSDTLMGFTQFLQVAMREASTAAPESPIRAATTAYAELFEANAGLMKCLLHHHDSFPEARAAFQRLNGEWIATVTAAAERRLLREGRAGEITHDALLRRGHALGGMVDQYLSGLILSADPTLTALSSCRAEVIDTLCLIWERGMQP